MDKDEDVIARLERAKRESHANQEKNCIEVLIEANQDYVRKTSIQMKWFEIIEGDDYGVPVPPATQGAEPGVTDESAVSAEARAAREAREAKSQRLFVFQIIFGYSR